MKRISSIALLALLACPQIASAEAPAEAMVFGEGEGRYKPTAIDLGGMKLEVPLFFSGTVEGTQGFAVDRDGMEVQDDYVASPLIRFGLRFSSGSELKPMSVLAEYEHDVSGFSGAAGNLEGIGYPLSDELDLQLRKAYARVVFDNRVFAGSGVMTSHWGMGLIANDGAHRWEPGSAYFGDPRGGDRVIRGFLGLGISEELGLGVTLAADSVLGDDVLQGDEVLRETEGVIVAEDDAVQFVAAVHIGRGKKSSGGIYAVYRDQEAVDGDSLKVFAIDVAGRSELALGDATTLTLEAEGVFITGETTLAPSVDFPKHDVRQLGIASRVSVDHGGFGGVLDFLYASGDHNFDDDRQTGFKADRNYELGFLLFRHVMAAHTARAVATASNLDLVGQPAEDIERLPTRGSASNTIAFFPRGWFRPIDGLEVYGGPLVAFSAVDMADPFNSRIGGGTPRNALDGEPGRYLGTELDVGLRYRAIAGTTQVTAGIEGGYFIPGAAFADGMSSSMDNIFGVRTMLGFEL